MATKRQNKSPSSWDFSRLAKKTCDVVGSFWSFLFACLFCVIWLITGPLFNYSDTWQLIINTSTTVITFLIVFLIQNAQNRDTAILNLKLDELIKSLKAADNRSLILDDLSETELKKLIKNYKAIKDKKTGE
ncbi:MULTISPECIES: low affinity iron permease family protein [Legionella]|uniref:Low affinity iron permease family protein n=1 Tax=Legionella septentrionalis TaxID=2498109 RepID=A0A433JGB2_9GAMM|nr:MULTISPECIES: low affinity iron permease family protein [Legionella]MCP0913228.1 low affinity iron permease family protein [Legionella sp. 27cVA30]RUQ79157.1 low affinity iron permease family protein [Legionella septentrionalis]RUR02396.1 low affinity iron permease family protein [Legionella septentrionalis]RUR10339.1 low affinity iron permease family protein [Legionella septentrionalis]RUR17053.1 low affinity iron permease family protein [Legionella septentrionalis]